MRVYGDRARDADPRQVVGELRDRLGGLDQPGPPIARHGRLAAVFILAAELAQGLADHAMVKADGDGPSPAAGAAFALLMPLAQALIASWRALGDGAPPPAPDASTIAAALAGIEALALPPTLRLKTAEGYAYYALYPEAYAVAALRLGLDAATTVVGLRSIGTGLAAVAATACGATTPATVRPVGHPFRREIRLTPQGEAQLRVGSGGLAAVVDEGPGLSGSSFGATADRLEALGFAPDRIVFLSGHGGELGPQAQPRHRARWAAARREAVDFDTLALRAEAPGQRLQSWFADLLGEAGALRDISGGGWRALQAPGDAAEIWPAVNTFQERRKFLVGSGGCTLRLKFAGLGAGGEAAFEASRRLGTAGFAITPLALRHGFVARPWITARRLRASPPARRAFAAHLGRYLGWRAAHLPAPGPGAPPLELLEMARVNAAEALGERALAAPELDPARWADAPTVRPVWTDNRLQPQEWLQTPDGGWVKTDAVDHAMAHDLVGPQDIAWDVAGAAVEFGLDAVERAVLLERLTDQAPVEPALASLLEPAYAAFQLGACTLAAAAHGGWPEEQARLAGEADRYRAELLRRLAP